MFFFKSTIDDTLYFKLYHLEEENQDLQLWKDWPKIDYSQLDMVFLTSIQALKGATMPTGLFFLSGTFGGKESASLEELNELL